MYFRNLTFFEFVDFFVDFMFHNFYSHFSRSKTANLFAVFFIIFQSRLLHLAKFRYVTNSTKIQIFENRYKKAKLRVLSRIHKGPFFCCCVNLVNVIVFSNSIWDDKRFSAWLRSEYILHVKVTFS